MVTWMGRITDTWLLFCPFYSHLAILAYVTKFNTLSASEVITLLTLPAFLSKEGLRRMDGNKGR